MQKTRLLFTAASIAAISFYGCSKSNSTSPTGTTGNNSPYKMTATIGSVSWSRDSCGFYFNNAIDTSNAEIYGWAGEPTTRSDYYPQIYIYFPYSYHGKGTYTFTSPGNLYAKLVTAAGDDMVLNNGTVTITAIYPNVVGTFSFTTENGVVISGGNFIAQRQ